MAQKREDALQRQQALSRWDNEGGAEARSPRASPASSEDQTTAPKMASAELVELHIRVIALENLVIALLAAASDRQLELAREMAAYISPRPGSTPHPLTTHAASDLLNLVERACRFRSGELP